MDYHTPYRNWNHYYTLKSLSLFWLAESVQWIFEVSACDVISADYSTIIVLSERVIMSRSRVIMSISRALCCLPSVKKQKHDFHFFFQCLIKQLLDSGFVISRIIKVSVRFISLSLPTSTSITLDITKTSSKNCLLSASNFLFPFSKTWTNVIQLIRAISAPRFVKISQGAINVHVKKDLNWTRMVTNVKVFSM